MKKLILILAVAALIFAACTKDESLADLPSHYITLKDGSKMHYKVSGEGNITLMFVHGFGCDLNAWNEQYKGFCDDTVRMIFVDLPGYGNSERPQVDYTLHYFADALKQVSDTVGAKNLFLVGHSLGTPVCRQFVFDYPAYSSALCDIDGVYCFYNEQGSNLEASKYKMEIDAFVEMFHGEKCQSNIETFVSSLSGPYTSKEIEEYAQSVMPKTPEYVAYSTMKNLVDTANWTGEKINIPSLIICTRNSGIPENNRQLMDHLYNNATYLEFDNTGHFVMMEDPAIVNNLIERSYERWRKTQPRLLK